MAKPINLYQGAAPTAMAQMGAGLSEAGARIGQSLQQGYQSLGQGLSSGISAAAGAYKEYKDLQSQVKGSEKMFESLKSYLPKDVQTAFDNQIQELNTNGSLKDKAAFYEQAKSFLGSSVANTLAIQKQQMELDAAMARQQASEAAAKERKLLDIQARAEELGGSSLPAEAGATMPGAPFYDQGLAPQQQQPVNPFGSLLKKRHFGKQ